MVIYLLLYPVLHTGSKGSVGPAGLPGSKDSCQSGLLGPVGPDGYPGHPGEYALKSCDVLYCELQKVTEYR